MITSQQPWSDSPWLAEGLVSVIPHILNYEITSTDFEWWRKYNFLHFSSFQKKYPFPIKEVVPSVHVGSMESNYLYSAFRSISDIREVKLRNLSDIVSVFQILPWFFNILRTVIVLVLTDYQYRLRCWKGLQLNSVINLSEFFFIISFVAAYIFMDYQLTTDSCSWFHGKQYDFDILT